MTFNKNVILSEIFGITITDASTLINNMKHINKGSNPLSTENEYEFELRFVDGNRKDCSLDTYNTLNMEDFHEILYSDDIFITYNTPLYDVKIREVHKQKDYTKMITEHMEPEIRSIIKKTNICSVESKKNSGQSKYETKPIVMRLSMENTIDASIFELTDVNNYQRRQRVSYMSNRPLLSNWRIDKTIRFYTNEKDNKKLLYNKLTKENVINPKYYDSLDVEFEYIGDFTEFEESLYKLFEMIYPNNFHIFNISYNNLSHSIRTAYNLNLHNLFTQVGIVTNSFIQNENITEYVYEEKYDGERVILICMVDTDTLHIFEYTKTYFKEIYTHQEMDKKKALYIVDAEKVLHNDVIKYVVFDCLIYNNTNINTKAYTNRLKYVSKFVKEFNEVINVLCIEHNVIQAKNEDEVYKMWKRLCHIVKTRFVSENKALTGVKIDGLILHKNKTNFVDGEIYKLKNAFMMSTDFKLMWIPEKKVYYLYLTGNVSDLLRTQPLNNQYSKQHFGYSPMEQTKNVYMLFDSPFVQRSYEFEPDVNWYDDKTSINKYMDTSLRHTIDVLMNKMCKNPMSYNNTIIEMTLYGDTQKWLPLRERRDKEFSNNYKVGLSNIECIYNRLSPSYCKKGKVSKQLDFFYKSALEKHFNELYDHDTILWHTHDYEQINNIIHLLPINELYVVSNDRLTLTKACETVYSGNEDIIPLNNKSIVHNVSSIVNINCIYYDNKKETSMVGIYSELLKTTFVEHSVSIYLETDYTNMTIDMNNYIEYLEKIISTGGYYVMLSEKRLQRENKNKLSKVFTLTVDNERLIRETDGKIMYLSVFMK